MAGEAFAVDELADLLERDRPFYGPSGGGVTFSGGEPMAQPAFLEAVLLECRDRGLHTAVDTCGFASDDTVVRIGNLADLVLYDLKHMDPVVHRMHTGVDNRPIMENLQLLSGSGADVWIRLPLIPGFNDDDANIDATGAFVAALPNLHPIFVLPYHGIAEGKNNRLGAIESFNSFCPPDSEKLDAVQERLESRGLEVTIGGSP